MLGAIVIAHLFHECISNKFLKFIQPKQKKDSTIKKRLQIYGWPTVITIVTEKICLISYSKIHLSGKIPHLSQINI